MSTREKVLFACVVLLSVVVLVLSFSLEMLLAAKINFTQTAASQTVPAPPFPASPPAAVSPTISVFPSPAASATIPIQILPTLVSTVGFPTALVMPTPLPSPTPVSPARTNSRRTRNLNRREFVLAEGLGRCGPLGGT
jgi:hypothetical protein